MAKLFKNTTLWFILTYLVSGLSAQTVSYSRLLSDIQVLQKQLVPDKRVALLNVQINDTLTLPIKLSGETNLPEAKKQIVNLLAERNITFIDSLRLLPDAAVGEKVWALSTLSVSNLRAMPSDASELVSQTLMGTPLKVLDYVDKWYRVQTPENYIGWMDTSGLKPLTFTELERWKNSDRYVYIASCGTAFEKGEVVTDLVIGDLFEVESTKQGFLLMKTPDGRHGYVPKADCMSFNEWSSLQPKADNILSVSKQLMGSPYLWGGTSAKATDCSGFVKLAYYSQGIILARDASQQARYGQVIDFTDTTNLQAGDLLFFGKSAERINHVGIYLGKGNFIHSSGKVSIGSINPTDPKYLPSRKNVAARRILNSLNTDGITSVKNHPWYSVQN